MGIAEVVSVLLSARDEDVCHAAQHLQSMMRGEAAPSLVRSVDKKPPLLLFAKFLICGGSVLVA